jgi:hypothetical protein
MADKGMSQTLVIIVAAVVILVTALVLLTIFGSGIAPVASITEVRNNCQTIGDASCSATGQLPPTWNAKIYKVGDLVRACSDVCESTCTTVNNQPTVLCTG